MDGQDSGKAKDLQNLLFFTGPQMAGAFAVRFSKCSPLRNPLSGALALRRRSSRASLEILAPRSLISSQLERGTRVGIARASISTSAIGGRTERKAEMDLFQISPSSVLKLQRGDITKWLVNGSTDAIVSSRQHPIPFDLVWFSFELLGFAGLMLFVCQMFSMIVY